MINLQIYRKGDKMKIKGSVSAKEIVIILDKELERLHGSLRSDEYTLSDYEPAVIKRTKGYYTMIVDRITVLENKLLGIFMD